MSEHLQIKGHLVEQEMRSGELKLKIMGLRNALRMNLDPFSPISDLPSDLIAQQALELAQLHIQYKECSDTIAAIKKALGQ